MKTTKSDKIHVSISGLSIRMNPVDYYSGDKMREKFKQIRRFKEKVMTNDSTKTSSQT